MVMRGATRTATVVGLTLTISVVVVAGCGGDESTSASEGDAGTDVAACIESAGLQTEETDLVKEFIDETGATGRLDINPTVDSGGYGYSLTYFPSEDESAAYAESSTADYLNKQLSDVVVLTYPRFPPTYGGEGAAIQEADLAKVEGCV